MGGNSARANSRPFFPETSSSHEARKIKLDGWLFLLKIVKASYNETTLAPASARARPRRRRARASRPRNRRSLKRRRSRRSPTSPTASSSPASAANGSLLHPATGFTVSMWELSNMVCFPNSKPGATIQRLFPARFTLSPAFVHSEKR